ncbi:MAG: thiamine diphosphokinase [Candidatus Thermoplasmatota archaeon]|nr:thiamine diphosphokinase [Candidatus Thermoplasmatota archaeon]
MSTSWSRAELPQGRGELVHALLWCNGETPSDRITSQIVEGVTVFGVDGGTDRATESGYEVAETLGDLDSISQNWVGKTTELADQSSSDLAKSLNLLAQRGYREIDVVGCDGGTISHQLGNWAALCEAIAGPTIRLHHEDSVTHRIHSEERELHIGQGIQFSIFALTPCNKVRIEGAQWELQGSPMSLSTKGLHNISQSDSVRIGADGILAVMVDRA